MYFTYIYKITNKQIYIYIYIYIKSRLYKI